MDCWIIGFEFKIEQTSKIKKNSFKIGIFDFPYTMISA
jgi:hypothetical protein